MTLVLSNEQLETVRQHGQIAYPEEGGGLLLGHFDDGRAIVREVQPFERGTLSRIGDNLADLHLLARLDRHRAPHALSKEQNRRRIPARTHPG